MEQEKQDKLIEGIKLWQQFMGGEIHPIVKNELLRLPFYYYPDVIQCDIEANLPESLSFHLKKKFSLKTWFFKLLGKVPINQEELLLKAAEFWLPFDKNGKKPKVTIHWHNGEHKDKN